MPVEKSAGAIVFKRDKKTGKILYLLLHYPSASHRAEKNFWDFPKGHVEKGEKEIDTVKREIFEETGLKNIKIYENFKETIKYYFRFQGKTILKFVTFYLAEAFEEKVKISPEHIGFLWLDFEKAKEKLTFENSKKILEKANEFLEKLS